MHFSIYWFIRSMGVCVHVQEYNAILMTPQPSWTPAVWLSDDFFPSPKLDLFHAGKVRAVRAAPHFRTWLLRIARYCWSRRPRGESTIALRCRLQPREAGRAGGPKEHPAPGPGGTRSLPRDARARSASPCRRVPSELRGRRSRALEAHQPSAESHLRCERALGRG